MINEKDISITEQHNGSLLLSCLNDDITIWYKKVYYGYSRKEAIKLFIDWINNGCKK